ncbi:hypothetical protein KUTeg_004863 [Tegillarca granosa]|uniref:Ankyrin repeat domain-containing protein 53 n=1 Tax=Tegillarca granosa TaxID=220873 RepID=A0ABQ9FI37_TEGGR|nr:hypothetical protein KUTeg_004863 [Tegillarca granosa]
MASRSPLYHPNNDGITPIHQAASEGHVQCLKLLIEVGAKIDLKDCRGHSPLDLAKLWGHKKCARILAAEMWHQDKDHVAKEMREKAFQEWLEKRNLQQSSTGPKGRENEKKDEKKDSLYKPNSKTAKYSGEFTSKKDFKKDDNSSKIYLNLDEKSPTSVEPDYRSRFHLREGTDLYKEPGAPQSPVRRMSKERAKTATYTNPNTWKIPLKVPEKDYVPNLTDDYPRDMYTIMPQVNTAPKYYDGKHGPAIYVTDEDAETKKVKKISNRSADLPKEVINRVMSKDPTLTERPVFFKPKHIYDVDKKKKYDIDLKGRPEIPMHLGSDLTSALFRQSLLRQATTVDKGSIKSPSSDTSSTVSSDWQKSSRQKENIVSMLNRMKKPARFPNIKGEEYDLNFGNIFVINQLTCATM